MKKLKAGSLQLVTFIVVVIALLLSSFIILIHIHKQFRIKTNHIIEAVRLVDKGINNVLQNEIAFGDSIDVQLVDDDYRSITIHKSFWGTFEKVHSIAKIKNKELTKIALTGSKQDKTHQPTLVLRDNNKSLVLVGNTKIEGTAFLPNRGVKSGNIAGTSYYGEKYIYGSTAFSKSFPKINKTLLSHINDMFVSAALNDNTIEYLDLNTSKKHKNSFEKPLQLIYSNTDIVLSEVSVIGHIQIQSKSKIIVDASAKLIDVLLVAPEIEIRSNVIGSFQAFATESINVAEHVDLRYPSALVLIRDYKKDDSNVPNMILIGNHSIVKGNVIVLGSSLTSNYDAQVKIETNAVIKGTIYCEQNLELRGTVYGTVFTNNFIIKEKGSIYQNHLFNAKISSTELESEFVSFPIEKSNKGIAKWLY